MESLLVLAAFSFGICTEAPQAKVNELDFRQKTNCSQSEGVKTNSSFKSERLTLAAKETVKKEKFEANEKLYAFASKFSPSISLNKVSWMNSSFTEEYDPSLSVRVRRAESNNGYEALLQVSIPL